MATEEHSFAPFIRILARGKTKARDLTADEAEEAMAMIMAGDVEPEQLGAFLMLMRLKEETADEVAGFVRAARTALAVPVERPTVDLDWSSYAGKRRQLPWFLLAALVLVENGIRVFMHGTDGHTPGRVYTGKALEALGIGAAEDLHAAAREMEATGFAYLSLATLAPRLEEIINLKPVLGLRSPVNTMARLLNPFGAPHLMQGIFHPSFLTIHQNAMHQLGERRALVFRGEGGEIERRPNKALSVYTVDGGNMGEDHWPALLKGGIQEVDEEMRIERLAAVWRGDDVDAYADAAITGTLAVALKLLGRAGNAEGAQAEAERLWAARDRGHIRPAA